MRSCILSAVLAVLAPVAWGLDVVRDGEPVAAICVDVEAGGPVRRAAELCVAYIQESTGAALPIVSEAPEEGPVLFIGPNP